MARQWTALRNSRLILGAALVGLGIFMLYENLTIAAGWLSHAFGADSDALGIVPALMWAISQWMPTHAANQHFLHHILMSSWPLLLVILGTVLTRETVPEGTALPSINWSAIDLATMRSTSKFRSYYQSSSLPLDMRQNRISE